MIPCMCSTPDYCTQLGGCLRVIQQNLVPVVGVTSSYMKPFADLTPHELSLVPKDALDLAVERARGRT